jgi:hypothetical protein
MQQKIELSSSSSGLGDILLLTSICKNLLAKNKKATVVLSPKVERFSILFDGLADVEIGERNNHIPDIGCGHYATRKLRNFFEEADLLDNRPLVLHSDIESERWAAEYLNNKPNPIIIVPNCSKQWHSVRSLSLEACSLAMESMINSGCTPILCESSENPVLIEMENKLTDLPLSKYICLLRKAGLYHGCNTGDMHLAIAVNASCMVIQPKNNPFFNEEEWNYKHPSIQYVSI